MFALKTLANLCTTQSSKYICISQLKTHSVDFPSSPTIVTHRQNLRAKLASIEASEHQSSGWPVGGKRRGADVTKQLGSLSRWKRKRPELALLWSIIPTRLSLPDLRRLWLHHSIHCARIRCANNGIGQATSTQSAVSLREQWQWCEAQLHTHFAAPARSVLPFSWSSVVVIWKNWCSSEGRIRRRARIAVTVVSFRSLLIFKYSLL